MNTRLIDIDINRLIYLTDRSGDIDNKFRNDRSVDLSEIKENIQSLYGSEYEMDAVVEDSIEYKGYIINITSEIDGILKTMAGISIDNIVLTSKPLKTIGDNLDLMQLNKGRCIAYIIGKKEKLKTIVVRQTYYNRNTQKTKILEYEYSIKNLENYINNLFDKLIKYTEMVEAWELKRNSTIKQLEFPYQSYRAGQRDLAIAVYKTIRDKKNLFVQAPTGVGKTLSAIFPAIKAMGENKTDKIFYATAKTITRRVAEESIELMRSKGLSFKSLTLTAKEKVCFNKGKICSPECCEYAKGHYDRVNAALEDLYKSKESFSREDIEVYALEYKVCPFELSLDLSMMADCVICDYNYLFDPQVYLKRYFETIKEDYIFLVDEAHNLVDRARDMFSTQAESGKLQTLRDIFDTKRGKLYNTISNACNYVYGKYQECLKKNNYILDEKPIDLCVNLQAIADEAEKWLVSHPPTENGYKELVDTYFDITTLIKVAGNYDEGYKTYVEKTSQGIIMRLMCIDTSFLMKQAISRGTSAIFFSATLEPLDYYSKLLGGGTEDYRITIPSPFDPNNMKLLVHRGISTKYKERENSYQPIVDSIGTIVKAKKGNYLVYFPSYMYMNEVYDRFTQKYPSIEIIRQEPGMEELQREEFVDEFKPNNNKTLVGFAILGGIFSEGLDLKGDKLSGTIIVGVGLPQICAERDIIKGYFNGKNGLGYEYSYIYPGMNKVLQAAGRVIRTENDRGVILLIDERFSYKQYQNLFPSHWKNNIQIKSMLELNGELKSFWNK